MDRIMFREFKGDNVYVFSIKEKNDKIVLKRFWKKRVCLSHETFKQLEKLGEKVSLKYGNKICETLFVFIVPQSYLENKLIQEEEGKATLNIAMCLDKELVYEAVRKEVGQNPELVYEMLQKPKMKELWDNPEDEEWEKEKVMRK